MKFMKLIDAENQTKIYVGRNFSNCTCLTQYVKCDFNKQIFATTENSRNVILTDNFFALPPFSLLRDFSFQNTSEHFAIRFRQSYLIWKVCDVTAIELSSKE